MVWIAGRTAAAFLEGHALELQNMLMRALTVLPPGAEDLALRTLSSLLVHSHTVGVLKVANEELTAFLSGKNALAEAALRETPWWQKVLFMT